MHEIALSMAGALTLVAWGYLLGVASEKRHVLLSTAAAITLISSLLTLLTQTLFRDAMTAGPGDLVVSMYAATSWLLAVVYWPSLFGGVLLELPRDRDHQQTHGPESQHLAAGATSP